MSFDRTHAGGQSHGRAAAAGHATPGKQTQVERAGGGGGAQLKAHGASQRDGDRDEVVAARSSPSGVNMARLEDFIAKHEGYVDHVYLDSRGFPTAGIGHLLPRGRYRVGQKISAAQITEWFKDDVADAIRGAKQDLGASAYERLNEPRKMVVIDMVFNLGTAGFAQFQATIHAIRTGAFGQAASHMLQSLWASQVGNRAREDAAMMRSGELGGGGGGNDRDDDVSIGDVREGRGVLKRGSRGPAVARIQRLLRLPDDGIFGPQTENAVEKLQRRHKLDVDGIVGRQTLEALENRNKAKDKPKKGRDDGNDDDDDDGGDDQTGGVRAPDGDDDDDDRGDDRDDRDRERRRPPGKWSKAPSLEAVKDGRATLQRGDRGPAVRHVQRLLAVDVDGRFGPDTRGAVVDFQRDHHERGDGIIDAGTLRKLTKDPVDVLEDESRRGSEQRHRMLSIARARSQGHRPDGRCYYHICQYLIACGGYGKIKNPYTQFPQQYLPYARHFADLMNARGAKAYGLERVSIDNPYDAPAGAIVVVAPGSPGTAHPEAGDIAIADGNGHFFNGGMMSYSGRAGWDASSRARLMGCFIPQ
jgi:peptidoglycan hydrolase-like protein with peptidoglycan-binding domain/GH24 family phage-related lysozyme (muramidase)